MDLTFELLCDVLCDPLCFNDLYLTTKSHHVPIAIGITKVHKELFQQPRWSTPSPLGEVPIAIGREGG